MDPAGLGSSSTGFSVADRLHFALAMLLGTSWNHISQILVLEPSRSGVKGYCRL